jgi:hypothetical protein
MARKFKGKFSQHELDITINVLLDSDYVKNWVNSELKFVGVDMTTPQGKKLKEQKMREIAMKIIS